MSSEIKAPLGASMLKSVIDNINVSINVFDRKGKRIFANPYYYHLSGKPAGSKLSPDMVTGENRMKGEYLTKKLMQAMRQDKVFEVHNFFYKSKSAKTIRYFDFVIGPLKDEKGKIIGGYTTVKDVTTRFLAKRNLMRLNNTLENRVEERTKKLEEINKELKRVSEEKNMMVSDIAHDIKTILTIIKGNMEMLDIGKKATEPFEIECQKEIEEEIEKMNRVSSDLVFIAKSQQYADMFKLEKFDVSSLLKETLKKYKIFAEGKISIINNNPSGKPLYVTADRAKISVLIGNLIENAIKFRQAKGAKLLISLQNNKEVVRLIFKDNGIGVDKDKLVFIFSPFFQADKTNNKNRDKKMERGFGLGLAICKKIVEAHKGTIIAKSEGLNKGTTFEVSLPKNIEKGVL